jgi:uncharacterized membrane protein YdjX (TVP38/TMEM64 family)
VRTTAARRALTLLLGVGALAVAAWLLPLRQLPELVDRIGPVAPYLGVLIGSALLIALIPRTPVSLACGALFGATVGSVCAIATAVVGALVTFGAGRWLGREFVAARAGRRLARLDGMVARGGVLAVATVRCIPVAPFGVVGYAYGASAVRFRHYLAGTLINVVPGAVSYAIIGAAATAPGRFQPLALVPAALGLALSVAVAGQWGWRALRRPTAGPAVAARHDGRHDDGRGMGLGPARGAADPL